MTRSGLTHLAAALTVSIFTGATPSWAQTGAPALTLSLGYDGRLLFKVLDIQIDATTTSDTFEARARLVSTGILALVKHVNEVTSSQGRIVRGAPQPGRFTYQHLTGKTHRKVLVIWSPGDVSMTAAPDFKSLGDPPASRDQKLAAADPLTSLVRMTLTSSRDSVCRRSYLFFDGKQLYALDMSNQRDAPASETESRLGLVNHFRCDMRFREVAGFGKKDPDKRNQGLDRPMDLDFAQVGPSGPWVISRIHAKTPLGWASIELKRLRVSGPTV